jgi:hypothetical protein
LTGALQGALQGKHALDVVDLVGGERSVSGREREQRLGFLTAGCASREMRTHRRHSLCGERSFVKQQIDELID